MDIEEFEKRVQPRARRSRLEPFAAQIFELRQKGYTHDQVREWLAENSLVVTTESVRKFVNSRKGKGERELPPLQQSAGAPAEEAKEKEQARPTEEVEVEGLDAKQRREALADKYVGSGGNSLLNRLGAKK